MQPSLETVKRKLRHAEKDLDVLRAELVAFDNAQTARISQEIDPKDGAQVFRFHVLRQPDPEWEITVGEVAYQVRSALDQLVTQLVALNGGNPDQHHGGFPIFTRRKDYWEPKKRGGKVFPSNRDVLLQGVKSKHRAIIDGLQPYERGAPLAIKHDPLTVLNAVCNGDKHRYGHPSAVVLRSTAYAVVDEGAREITLFARDYGAPNDQRPATGKPIEDGAVIDRIGGSHDTAHLPTDMPVKVGGFRIGVRFGSPRVFVFDLIDILEYVRTQVVARIEPFF